MAGKSDQIVSAEAKAASTGTAAAKPPLQTFTSSALLTNWATEDKSAKLAWLHKEPLPGVPTVSLGQCYRRAETLSRVFYIVFSVLHKVRIHVLKTRGKDSAAMRLLDNFVEALNEGIGKFQWELQYDNKYLLAHGSYPTDGISVSLEGKFVIPGIPENRDAFADAPIDLEEIPENWTQDVMNVLLILIERYPALQKVRPGIGASYSQLFQAAFAAGQTFHAAYTGKPIQHLKKPQTQAQVTDHGSKGKVEGKAEAEVPATNTGVSASGAEAVKAEAEALKAEAEVVKINAPPVDEELHEEPDVPGKTDEKDDSAAGLSGRWNDSKVIAKL